MEAIADKAGVSRRTVFRYVDAKEDLAYIQPVLWLDVFEEGLEEAEGELDLGSCSARSIAALSTVPTAMAVSVALITAAGLVALTGPRTWQH